VTASFTVRTPLGRRASRLGAPESHQRVHAKWPELAPLDQLRISMRHRPVGQALERKFRPQAEWPRLLREETLDGCSEAVLRVEVVDQDDLATWANDARKCLCR
jgi:hypothetical protein